MSDEHWLTHCNTHCRPQSPPGPDVAGAPRHAPPSASRRICCGVKQSKHTPLPKPQRGPPRYNDTIFTRRRHARVPCQRSPGVDSVTGEERRPPRDARMPTARGCEVVDGRQLERATCQRSPGVDSVTGEERRPPRDARMSAAAMPTAHSCTPGPKTSEQQQGVKALPQRSGSSTPYTVAHLNRLLPTWRLRPPCGPGTTH